MISTYGTFAVTGPQGSGKSLVCTRIARDFLLNGRLLVSNLDFYLYNLLPYWSKSVYIRVPDIPSADDLWAVGQATTSANEKDFGLLIIDEIAVIANAREWKNEKRTELISYLRQARKHGFNSFFISQDVESIDAQIRKSLVEHVVYCKRTDRINIPLISNIFRWFGINLKFPLLHVATVRLGLNKTDLVVDRWIAKGAEFYAAYNTKQKFRIEGHDYDNTIQYRYTPSPVGGLYIDAPYTVTSLCNNTYSVLSAWHIKGRYYTKQDYLRLFIRKYYPFFMLLTFIVYAFLAAPDIAKTVKLKQAKTETIELITDTKKDIKGVIDNGFYYTLILKDGTYKQSSERRLQGESYIYLIEGSWHEKTDNSKTVDTVNFF
jgi:hypothetical protein